MLDGILFERKGVPAATIVTEPFVPTGRAMAEAWGVPDYRFLVMPHPTANLTEEQLDQRAREIVPQVVELLLDKSLAPK
ncbi:MAG: hypothetical protein ACE5JU_02370 [Candidatus Binatia bacterium]